jgi:hypothetical protein
MTSGAVLTRPETVAKTDPRRPSKGRSGAVPERAPVFVGHVEVTDHDGGAGYRDIATAPRFTAARLLVTVHGVAVGQVVVPLRDGRASAATVQDTVLTEMGGEIARAAAPLPAVTAPLTVVVPTRGRPESLIRCLCSLLRSDHPRLTVLVVDNDPDASARSVVAVPQVAT